MIVIQLTGLFVVGEEQLAVLIFDHNVAVGGIAVGSGVIRQIVRRLGALDLRRIHALELLRNGTEHLRHEIPPTLVPVSALHAQHAVDDLVGRGVGIEGIVEVGQRHHAQLLIGNHRHQCGEAVDVAAVLHHHMAAVGLHEPAHAVREEIHFLARHQQRLAHEHIGLVHFLHCGLGDQLLVADLAVIKVKLHPLEHVVDGGHDGTGRSVGRADALCHVLAVALEEGDFADALKLHRGGTIVGRCVVGVGLNRIDIEGAAGHAQGLEDLFLDELLPGLAGHLLHEHAGGHDAGILIAPVRAEGPARLHVAQIFHHFLTSAGAVNPVSVVAGQAGAVAQQVAHGDVRSGERLLKAQPGHIADHGLIPFQNAAIHQNCNRRGGECLRAAADLIQRVGIGLDLLIHVGVTETLGQLHLAVLDDADRDGRLIPGLEFFRDHAAEAFHVDHI